MKQLSKSSKAVIKLTVFMVTSLLLQVSFAKATLQVGAEQLTRYLPLLQGNRVALVVNQTSMVGDKHLVDVLLDNKINVKAVFAPEHGFRGNRDAGEKFSSTVDEKTGVPLISIYGKQRKPSIEILANIDVIIFDIQDVGVRFYTYISSMHYMMEAAMEAGIRFIVLDRPNPNGAFVDGPVLEKEFSSFVGMHEIPLLHGMTVGELALMFKGQSWLNSAKLSNTVLNNKELNNKVLNSKKLKSKTHTLPLDLTVIPVKHYQRNMPYQLPIKPSPNLPNNQAIALYPSLGFFEATPVSIGRGTLFPFQVIGHDKVFTGDFAFTPVSTPGAAMKPKLMNVAIQGQDLRKSNVQGLDLSFIINWHALFKKQGIVFFTRASFMDKLSGTDKLRKAIEEGKTAQQIKQSWRKDLNDFIKLRKPYLLYPEFVH